MENYYHLTKKELSFLSSIQKPIYGRNNERLSKPVVVMTYKNNSTVTRVYSLKRYKKMVQRDGIYTDVYKVEICAML